MKKKFLILATTMVLLLTAGLSYGCQSAAQVAAATTTTGSQQTGIWVTGEGTVTVTPDIATVQLGIQAQATTVADAQSQAQITMNDVMQALTDNGVAEKDIQTAYYSVSQQTRWDSEKQTSEPTGYIVTNTVSVTIRDIEKAGQIIDAVAAAGGDLTRVNNISFSVDDPTEYYDEAREIAMADAKDTATQLADLAGVALGAPVYIAQNSASSPVLYRSYAMATMEDSAGSTSISAGELDITLTVQVNYAMQ